VKIHHFAIENKTMQHVQGNVLENFEKKSSQFLEESYQIIKNFG
jgi:hypothetical protein